VSIHELQLEKHLFLKNQTMVAVGASTHYAHGKVILCDFKPESVERSIHH
jgi:hypothetical protein